ncbi:MAG: PhzF family phenazine biosynthesis protein [Cytophagales bacterium]
MKIFQVDAFTDVLFGGNPAAVVPLENWEDNETLQKIAAENNLSETAYIVALKNEFNFEIRWFTPTVEVDLCGHATLAAAYVLFNELGFKGDKIKFNSKSGLLIVTKSADLLTLDFPSDTPQHVNNYELPINALGYKPIETFKTNFGYLFVFDSEQTIRKLLPDFDLLNKLEGVGVIATSAGENVDFVSRFFAPQSGIDEDPVTGSIHTSLTVLWASKLGKTKLSALQLSPRQGKLWLELAGDRVLIAGKAKLYLKGEIFI